MSTVRLKRLQADYEKLRDYVSRHPRLQLIQAEGTPPERYQLEYRIRSLRQTDDDLAMVKSHMVEIALPLSYPRMPPQCRMLTPIFHPNIAPHAICIGDHWSPGEPLWSIVARIGEMIAYQSYNTKSPLNGEAARWVDQHVDELPLDPVSMMPDDAGEVATAGRPPPVAADRRRSAATAAVARAARSPDRGRPPRPSDGSPARTAARSPDGGPSWPASSCDARAAGTSSDARCEPGHASDHPESTADAPASWIRAEWAADDGDIRRISRDIGTDATQVRRHREMLAISRVVLMLAFALVEVPGGRVAVRGLTGYPLPPSCVPRGLLGINCPGCGLTRSFIHLAEGDWRASWRSHRLGGLHGGRVDLPDPLPAAGPATSRAGPRSRSRWQAALGVALIALLIVNWLADVVTGRLASL